MSEMASLLARSFAAIVYWLIAARWLVVAIGLCFSGWWFWHSWTETTRDAYQMSREMVVASYRFGLVYPDRLRVNESLDSTVSVLPATPSGDAPSPLRVEVAASDEFISLEPGGFDIETGNLPLRRTVKMSYGNPASLAPTVWIRLVARVGATTAVLPVEIGLDDYSAAREKQILGLLSAVLAVASFVRALVTSFRPR